VTQKAQSDDILLRIWPFGEGRSGALFLSMDNNPQKQLPQRNNLTRIGAFSGCVTKKRERLILEPGSTPVMTLKWNLVTKGIRPHDQLHAKLEKKVAKLESHLEHFPSDAVHLQVNLERHPKRNWFATGLTLRLPSNILESKKSAADPVTALDQAVKALLREVAGLKSALRRENDWQRVARRKF
jgi:ribosome-associated translation inhibitor RaiA